MSYEKFSSTPTGLYIRDDLPCKTPLGFAAVAGVVTQGGAATPLTLGYDVQPRWGFGFAENNHEITSLGGYEYYDDCGEDSRAGVSGRFLPAVRLMACEMVAGGEPKVGRWEPALP